MSLMAKWNQQAKTLKLEIIALYLAYRNPKTPWYAKAFMSVVLGYALCPIDLIPDFIPVLGYLDDLVIIPGGKYLSIKMIPKGLMQECRVQAKTTTSSTKAKWIITGVIIAIWLLLIFLIVRFILQFFS